MPHRIAIKNPEATYLWKINQVALCSLCLDVRARGYEVHHIIKQGRSDEPCNYLLLCTSCHMVVEGHKIQDEDLREYHPPVTLANVLWVKQQRNPSEYNAERLQELYPRPLPEPQVLSQWHLRLSSRNDPLSVYRNHRELLDE